MKSKRKSNRPKPRAVVRRRNPVVALTKPAEVTIAESIERVLITGDLSPLSPEDRVKYYNAVCKSLGLNPMTVPFYYLVFKEYGDDDAQQGQQTGGKLQLYANKSCAEQLRKIHGISVVGEAKRYVENEIIYSEVMVQDRTGRTDRALGAVPMYKWKRSGQGSVRVKLGDRELANAWMKADTKARRRATLSICGLSFLDESELDTMNVIGGVTPHGRIYYYDNPQLPGPALDENARHGHLAGSEKAKQADEALKRVEEADRKLAEEKKPAKRTYKGRVELDYSGEGNPIVRGDLDSILDSLQKDCGMKWENDWNRIEPKQSKRLMQICEQADLEVVVIPESSGGKGSGRTRPPSTGSTTEGDRRRASSGQTDAPPVVSGTIERVHVTMTQNKQPMALITLVADDGSKPSFGCFDKDIFEILDKAKGLKAHLYILSRGQYTNIVGMKKVGSREFLEDGKTPIMDRNEDRGGELFK